MLSINIDYYYADIFYCNSDYYHYHECLFDECYEVPEIFPITFVFNSTDFISCLLVVGTLQNFVMPSVVVPSVIMLNVIMLSVVTLNLHTEF